MSKILIMGGSRGIGLETVKAALAAGHTVRAFSRHATQIDIANPALEKINGDALNPADVSTALQGIDIVIQTLGVAFSPDFVFKGTQLFSKATRVLVDAMNESGPKRLIAVTGIGAGDSRGHGGLLYDTFMFPLVLKRIYDDKDVQEQMIKASTLDWTIARPGILTDAPATGQFRALTDPKTWTAAPVSRADVALFLIQEAENPAYIHQTPVII